MRGVLFGGNANNRANAGFVYANSNNTPSNANANISSHLYFSKWNNNIEERRPCHLAEHITIQKGVGRNACCMGYRRPRLRKAKRMKRIGNLYERIISVENLRLADEKARRGKSDSYGVRLHDRNREANILSLHETLLTRSFKNSAYDTFTIYEPKERVIYRLPYYPDRILHHAIMNVLEPIWVSVFTTDTYSCIKNRGIHGAMRKVKQAMKDREGTRYCLKIDVRKFYPSIDHDVMKSIVRKKIKCRDTLRLLDEIIDSAPGVPIGNYLSQYLSNLYLAYFDHWIKEVKRVKYYFRYADDMVFLAPGKGELHDLLADIREYLNPLKIELKGNEQIFPIGDNRQDRHARGLDFVGFVFYHNQTLIRKSIKQNFCRAAAKWNKKPSVKPEDYRQALCSWFGWAKYSDSRHLLKTIIKKEYYDTCVLRQKAA